MIELEEGCAMRRGATALIRWFSVLGGLATLWLGFAAVLAKADDVHYQQIANLTGPGIPGGPFGLVSDIIYVDGQHHRVLLSDDSNTMDSQTGAVDAWNTNTNAYFGSMFGGFTGVTGFPGSFDGLGPDGLVVAGHRIWAGNGDGTVKVGDLATMTEIASIATGSVHRADELAYDPADQVILVTNPSDSPPFVSLISAKPPFQKLASLSLGANIPTDSIEQGAYDPIARQFIIAVRQAFPGDTRGEVATVNPRRLTVGAPHPLSVDCNPAGMALGPHGDVLLGCDSAPPAIFDRFRGQVDKQFHQACCSDEVWYNPGDGRYYAAENGNPNGMGTDPVVMVIDAREREFMTNIPIRNSSGQLDPAFHAVSVDPTTNHVYVPTSQGIQVYAAVHPAS